MNWMNQHKKWIGIAAVLVVVMIVLVIYIAEKKQSNQHIIPAEELWEKESVEEADKNSLEEEQSMYIVVDVKGAVKRPGVYECLEGERVRDVLQQAGGILEEGEKNAINLAMKLADEMVIYVPFQGEEVEQHFIELISEEKETELININKATQAELETLPGVGPSKAQLIIEFRETNGGFSSVEEIKKISGIGDKTFEKLEKYIKVK